MPPLSFTSMLHQLLYPDLPADHPAQSGRPPSEWAAPPGHPFGQLYPELPADHPAQTGRPPSEWVAPEGHPLYGGPLPMGFRSLETYYPWEAAQEVATGAPQSPMFQGLGRA